jgi:EAL domain-containing protein (putative c-di-GMP-specific phosphodiesterase class I)
MAPLLEIIAYGWRGEATPTSTPASAPATRAPAPNPAALRRTLALAIQRIECSFGAIVLADRAFTFSHRVSTEDSDVTISAVIDAVRDHMLKLMQVRREPLIANRIANARLLSAPYKLLVYPVRSHDERSRSTVPPGLLVFEFSEGSALEHSQAIEVMAARLRDVGCRIALDNCRAGFETLSTLRKWPVSRVKIDGVLTREVVSSPRAEALVRAVVQLAAGVGVETVAECVESEAVRVKLLDIGVDYAQGFHLAKPQPLLELFRSG